MTTSAKNLLPSLRTRRLNGFARQLTEAYGWKAAPRYVVSVGEVGQADAAWRVLLAEDHISVGAIESPPSGDAALQCPAHSQGDPGISTANLLEDGHRADARCGLQHRHDLAIPHPGKRVGTPASTRILFLGRQPRIVFDPIGGGGADPQAWLTGVLATLQDHPAKRIAELLPWNWKQTRQERAAA